MKVRLLFLNSLSENIRLPYKKCWFDFDCHPDDGVNVKEEDRSTRRGLLVFEVYPDILECYIFTYLDYFKKWMPPFLHYLICIGKKISDHKIKDELLSFVNKHESEVIHNLKTNIIPFPLIDYGIDSNTKSLVENDIFDLSILNSSLTLLSCKNITTEGHEAPVKLNKPAPKKVKGRSLLITP